MSMENGQGMEHIKKAMDMLNKIGGSNSTEKVFVDFLHLSAYAISNTFDYGFKSEREEAYLQLINTYSEAERNLMPEVFAEITLAAEYFSGSGKLKDIFGYIYVQGQYYKKSMGQFFTPDYIADFMADIAYSDDYLERIKTDGYISISEPTCGSGVMVLGFCNCLIARKINYQDTLLVEAWDLDIV